VRLGNCIEDIRITSQILDDGIAYLTYEVVRELVGVRQRLRPT